MKKNDTESLTEEETSSSSSDASDSVQQLTQQPVQEKQPQSPKNDEPESEPLYTESESESDEESDTGSDTDGNTESEESDMEAQSDAVSKSQIFFGQNYLSWKKLIKVNLKAKGWTDVLTPYEEPTKASDKAKARKSRDRHEGKAFAYIYNRLDPIRQAAVNNVETPIELFKVLDATYDRKGPIDVIAIQTKIGAMQYDVSKPLEEHLAEFERLCAMMVNADEKEIFPFSLKVAWLLKTLPDRWAHVKTVVNALSGEKRCMEYIKSLLLSEETMMKDSHEYKEKAGASAMYSDWRRGENSRPSQPPPWRAKGNELQNVRRSNTELDGRGRPIKCFRCNEMGHIGRNCPRFGDRTRRTEHQRGSFVDGRYVRRQANEASADGNEPVGQKGEVEERSSATNYAEARRRDAPFSQHFALCMEMRTKSGGCHKPREIEFALDSGATDTMVGSLDAFDQSSMTKVDVSIRSANKDSSLSSKSCGNINAMYRDERIERRLTLKEVLHVPNLRTNLMSVTKLMRAGYTVVFHGNEAEVLKGEEIVLKGKLKDGLVRVRVMAEGDESESKRVYAFAMTAEEKARIWYKRLAHVNAGYLEKLRDVSDGIDAQDFSSLKDQVCGVCQEAKQTRKSFNQERRRATRACEIMHVDLNDVSTRNNVVARKYILAVIDDYTHYSIIKVLDRKSNAAEVIEQIVLLAKTRHGRPVTEIRSDNGGEFGSNSFKKMCERNGITDVKAAPYHHEHQGRVERFNRTIMNAVRALMFESGAPLEIWPIAAEHANFILNRLPTRANGNVTPFERWFERRPDLSRVRIFGSLAHMKIETPGQTKLDPRTKMVFVVGNTETGYLLYDSVTKRLERSSNVVIDESKTFADFAGAKYGNLQDVGLEDGAEVKQPEDCQHEANIMMALNADAEPGMPRGYQDAVSGPDGEKWARAIEAEASSLAHNKVYSIVDRPNTKRVINTRWVFVPKNTEAGMIFKARLVARGFLLSNHELKDVYSPVPKLEIVRTFLSIVNACKLRMKQVDFVTAFLNGVLEEEVYVEIPEGFESHGDRNKVWKLNKALYGLDNASKVWNDTLEDFFSSIGMRQLSSCPCIFTGAGGSTLVLVYVDDLLIASSEEREIDGLIDRIGKAFEIKLMQKPRKFLGIVMERTEKEMALHQRPYVEAVLERFGMTGCNPVVTPMETGPVIVDESDVDRSLPYRELVGCLNYIAQGTRPDIMYAVNVLSRYQGTPTQDLFRRGKRILRYLAGTMDRKLVYHSDAGEVVTCYVDSDWAADPKDRLSVSGVLLYVYGNPVTWRTKKQISVAASSSEAEYVALKLATMEVKGVLNVLTELGFEADALMPVPVYEDNSGAKAIAETSETRRTKHIDLSVHMVREAVKKKIIKVVKVRTENQLADVLTKAICGPQHHSLVGRIFRDADST